MCVSAGVCGGERGGWGVVGEGRSCRYIQKEEWSERSCNQLGDKTISLEEVQNSLKSDRASKRLRPLPFPFPSTPHKHTHTDELYFRPHTSKYLPENKKAIHIQINYFR